jgi:hypothetical protein
MDDGQTEDPPGVSRPPEPPQRGSILVRDDEAEGTRNRRRETRYHSNASLLVHFRALAFDAHRPAPKNRIRLELVLYTSASETCQRALRTLERVLDKFDASQVSVTVRDLAHAPASGDEDAVVFTPTLVKHGPGPRTWIVGNLDQDHVLIDLFKASGVEPKRVS